jgi:2'-5' RNA ligase
MPLSSEFCVVATPLPAPEQIERFRWPAHVTLAGNFRVDEDAVASFPALVAQAVAGFAPFDVTLGRPALFGPEASIPVLLVTHPTVTALHEALADALDGVDGFRMSEPAYWRRGYRAHVSRGHEVTAAEGDVLGLTTISLVSLHAHLARRVFGLALGDADRTSR